jgi:branched-chain amino acid transport system substrate-binding protein
VNRARLLAGILGCVVGQLTAAHATEPIKIGEIDPLTGKEASFGQSTQKGVTLAIEEINARGGLLGRPLEVVVEDNQSRAGDSPTVARKLITHDKVVALISGGTSTTCLEMAPICQAARIPFVASSATAPEITEKRNYIFRVCFIDPFQGGALAKFARVTLKAKRVALLTSVSASYSVGLSKFFREGFTAAGGEIAIEQKYAEGDKDFRAQLTAIKAVAPDAIAVTGFYTEGALVCKQARELGLTCPLFGGDGWEAPELIEIGGAAVNGTYYCSHYSSESIAPEVQTFVKTFRAKNSGEIPDSNAALGYDAVMILADAITRAGSTDGTKIRDALAVTKNFAGVTGQITIDAQRNASKPVVVLAVRDGQAHFLQTIDP